jgi:hypothetical protein
MANKVDCIHLDKEGGMCKEGHGCGWNSQYCICVHLYSNRNERCLSREEVCND